MPELPEVETVKRGVKPHILNEKIASVVIRHPRLRWPIPADLDEKLRNQIVLTVERRAKYLLIGTAKGTLIIHLGMSGSLRIVKADTPPKKHDHVDIQFKNQLSLRLTDPRRFGAVLWTDDDPLTHTLLATLGPEPLSDAFTGLYLWKKAQKRKSTVKTFIMDNHIVVGVGNIYAAEALFEAGISPKKPAGKIPLEKYESLTKAIKNILQSAIKQGGTTLKDFVNSEGKKGYFRIHLKVYGRKNLPCEQCQTTLKEIRLGQRSTVYCPTCQR